MPFWIHKGDFWLLWWKRFFSHSESKLYFNMNLCSYAYNYWWWQNKIQSFEIQTFLQLVIWWYRTKTFISLEIITFYPSMFSKGIFKELWTITCLIILVFLISALYLIKSPSSQQIKFFDLRDFQFRYKAEIKNTEIIKQVIVQSSLKIPLLNKPG